MPRQKLPEDVRLANVRAAKLRWKRKIQSTPEGREYLRRYYREYMKARRLRMLGSTPPQEQQVQMDDTGQ